jgi:hypothetical protein
MKEKTDKRLPEFPPMYRCALSDEALNRLLADDVPAGDLTTESLGLRGQPGRLEFRARGAMTVCGVEEAARLFALAGASARQVVPSGATVENETLLLTAEGSADTLHQAWKVAETLVEWASGIASEAAALVRAAASVPVACTRKNVPGAKALSVKAIQAGGAILHRLGLSETLLVFAEHRLFLDESPSATMARPADPAAGEEDRGGSRLGRRGAGVGARWRPGPATGKVRTQRRARLPDAPGDGRVAAGAGRRGRSSRG